MTSQCRLPVYEQNKTLLPGLMPQYKVLGIHLVNTIQPLVRSFCIFLRVFLLWFPTQQPMLRLYTLRDFSIRCVARMLTRPELLLCIWSCLIHTLYTSHLVYPNDYKQPLFFSSGHSPLTYTPWVFYNPVGKTCILIIKLLTNN